MKIFKKVPVKPSFLPVKIFKKVPVKPNFPPVKKRGKNSKLGVKTKNPGVKNVKKAPKSGRENSKVPVKKSGKWPKKAFTPTFFSRPKKKNTVKKNGRFSSRQPSAHFSPLKKKDRHFFSMGAIFSSFYELSFCFAYLAPIYIFFERAHFCY